MHRLVPLFLIAALLVPAAAVAQELTLERDGDTITLTRPDGTVERFEVEEGTPLRLRLDDGNVIIEREGEEIVLGDERPFRRFRFGDGPRHYAFRFGPDGPPAFERFRMEDLPFEGFRFEDFAFDLDLDSLHLRGPEGFDLLRLPRFGMALRGVAPETRREIAEGERRSRELAARLRSTDEAAEQARLRGELREALEETFAAKQQARREQVEALRERQDALRQEVERLEEERRAREAARHDLIERRERELLGEDDALDW